MRQCARWFAIGCVATANTVTGQTPRIRDSAGIRIVENSARATAPVAFAVDSARVSDIGGSKDDPSKELNTSTFGFHVFRLSDGTRVLGDWTRLRFSDAFDKQIRHAGRAGQGPGEFGNANFLCVTRGDTIVATDVMNLRTSIWTRAGSLVREFPTGRRRTLRGCFNDGTYLVSVDSAEGLVLYQHGLEENTERPIGFHGGSAPRSLFMSARNLSVQTSVAVRGRHFYVADPATSEVRIYELPNKLIGVIRTDDPLAPITSDESDTWLEEQAGASSGGAPNGAPRPKPVRPPGEPKLSGRWPAFSRIAVDDAGRLWVQDVVKSREAPVVWTGFDLDGRMLGKFSLPAQKKIGDPYALDFTRDGVLVRREDSDGFVHVIEYRLKRR